MTKNRKKHRLSAAIAAIAFAAMLVMTSVTVNAADIPGTEELSSDYRMFGMFCADSDFRSGEAAPAKSVDVWLVMFSDTSLYADYISYADEYTYTVKMPYQEYEKLADACFSSHEDMKAYLTSGDTGAYATYNAADDTVSWDNIGGMGGFSRSYTAMAYLWEGEGAITVFGVYHGVGIDDPAEDWQDDAGHYVADNIFHAKAMGFAYDAESGVWSIDSWYPVEYKVEAEHIIFDCMGDGTVTITDSDKIVTVGEIATPSDDVTGAPDDNSTGAADGTDAGTGAGTDKADDTKGCGGNLGVGTALVIMSVTCVAAVHERRRRA